MMDKDINAKMDWVYSVLEDEESKFIFQKRRQFYESGNHQYIGEIVDQCVPELKGHHWCLNIIENLIQKIKETGEKVIIWGTGFNGRILLQICIQGGNGRILLRQQL